jgi:hypothetical protein
MKLILLFVSVLCAQHIYAQSSWDDAALPPATFKVGAGFSVDFPGLKGVTAFAELDRRISRRLEVGIGLKRMSMSGYPRTPDVREFTKATTIDFNFFVLPVATELHSVKIGVGYTFAYYDKHNAIPVILKDINGHSTTTWEVKDDKGKNSTFNLLGEYEYAIPGTNYCAGLRGAIYHAKDASYFAGAFVGVKF